MRAVNFRRVIEETASGRRQTTSLVPSAGSVLQSDDPETVGRLI